MSHCQHIKHRNAVARREEKRLRKICASGVLGYIFHMVRGLSASDSPMNLREKEARVVIKAIKKERAIPDFGRLGYKIEFFSTVDTMTEFLPQAGTELSLAVMKCAACGARVSAGQSYRLPPIWHCKNGPEAALLWWNDRNA